MPTYKRPMGQLWMLYMLECPLHTQMFKANVKNVFNWTSTYRSDSTLVAPYERWQYYNENVRQNEEAKGVNFAANKTKAVAWFVSNCGARNGRLAYAKELQKHIQVSPQLERVQRDYVYESRPWRSLSRSTFTAAAARSGVPAPSQRTASPCSTKTTSSTSHSRTPTARTTSRRSSSSTGWGELMDSKK